MVSLLFHNWVWINFDVCYSNNFSGELKSDGEIAENESEYLFEGVIII